MEIYRFGDKVSRNFISNVDIVSDGTGNEELVEQGNVQRRV